MFLVRAPQTQSADTTARRETVAFEKLERALDGVRVALNPPRQLAGVQLLTGNARDESEEPGHGAAANQVGGG